MALAYHGNIITRDSSDLQAVVAPHLTRVKGNSGATLNAFDVIYPVRNGPEWGTNVSMPETNIFDDLSRVDRCQPFHG